MKVQVNSDKSITVDSRVIEFVGVEANRSLKRFARNLTRVEVHLSDVNSHKFGTHDKRCLVEVRPVRQRPITASSSAATTRAAVKGALSKVASGLETRYGRMGPAAKRTHAHMTRKASLTTGNGAGPHAAPKRKPAAATATATTRKPKKKAIYRARRKAWPAR